MWHRKKMLVIHSLTHSSFLFSILIEYITSYHVSRNLGREYASNLFVFVNILFLNVVGAEDPRCPLAGLHVPISRAQEAYEKAGCPEHFQFIAERGIEHEMTPPMVKAASDWFDKFLKP
ncbi:hypothetical protein HPP92_021483 [Vanilla planifolia]|uniref:Uncharacterized protein n=1 Tax=Vanilla planifolia TaxID=51239 RepID=A0A835UJ08_VANPL|nr:hypothetical protein HPP92_021483 [Vanilla planifolia]